MKKFAVPVIFAAVVIFTTVVCDAEPSAIVIDIKQGTAYYEAGEKKDQEIAPADFIEAGANIRLDPGTEMILNYFAPGIREEIKGQGIITVGNEGSETAGDSEISRSETDYTPRLEQVAESENTDQNQADQNEAKNSIDILRPKHSVIRSPAPVFRWKAAEDASTYALSVSDVRGRLCFFMITRSTEFAYNKPNLVRGQTYGWNVSAMAGGKILATGQGDFSILGQDRLNEVVQAEKSIQEKYPKDSSELLTALAMLYHGYRLNDEAAEIVRTLYQKYPENF
jgi:hypothetical protein